MALKSPAITVENKQEELVTTMEQAFGTDELTSALVKPDQIILGKKIGSGGFKEVFRGTYKGQEVAIGVLFTEKFTENDMADLENELNLLKTLRHDNVVKFIGCAPVMDEDAKVDTHKFSQFYVLTEFCKYGDLSNFMQSRQKPGPKKVLGLIYDIAFGIMYLHNRRPEAIIHRDLKSLNILIDKDEKAKISDFGLSKVRKKVRGLMHTVVGTINWQAPEMWIDNPKYSEKVDVYACGLIFWEVLRWGKEYPFNELSDAQIYEQGKFNVVLDSQL
jgi:serine/threonine protein kinase